VKDIENGFPDGFEEPRTLEETLGSRASRTVRLASITAAIASAITSEHVFEALVDRMHQAAESTSAALWLVDDDGTTASLKRAIGYSEAARRGIATLSLAATSSVPAADALRGAKAIWIGSQAELLRRYPHLVSLVSPDRDYAICCLPLATNGKVLGVVGLTLPTGRDVNAEERALLLLAAQYASQAVERLRLFDAERRARSDAVEARARAEELYKFAEAVGLADNVDTVLEAALNAMQRLLGATTASVLALDDAGTMRFVASRGLSDEYQRAVEGHSPWPPNATAPEPVLVEDATTDPTMASYAPVFERERIRALAFIPLVARRRLLGKFMVYYDRPHVFAPHEMDVARAIATHLASVMARFTAISRLEDTLHSNELFAGVLAHDLVNPLGAIMNWAQVLRTRNGGGSARLKDDDALCRILSSARRMQRMIEQLLDFTRARAGGGIEVARQPNDAGEICAQALSELEIAHPEWKIRTEAVGELAGSWDGDRLMQVLSNLVANAGQHGSPEQEILVRLDGTSPDTVLLEVKNGGTVPAPVLRHLFDPFLTVRLGRDRSRGLGLGLFIVREIVRAHGGTVDVGSESGRTTFRVRLPRGGG
jgi:K+-sensing histidine kinase KdpD